MAQLFQGVQAMAAILIGMVCDLLAELPCLTGAMQFRYSLASNTTSAPGTISSSDSLQRRTSCVVRVSTALSAEYLDEFWLAWHTLACSTTTDS